MTRLEIVDDHRAMAEGLAAVLPRHAAIEIVGVASNAKEGLELARTAAPEVILIDVQMPGVDGLEAGPLFLEQDPQVRLLFYSAYANPEFVIGALALGARGYIGKEEPATVIARAVSRVAAGEIVFSLASRQIAALLGYDVGWQPPDGTPRLSERERDVVLGIARGRSLAEVAHDLGIGVATVRTFWARACESLGLESLPRRLLSPSSRTP